MKVARATLVGIAAGCLLLTLASAALALSEPGGNAESAMLALTNPDEFAWRLFLYVNHQAKRGLAGVADDGKASIRSYDDDRDVVWETWALSSGLDLGGQPPQVVVVTNKSEVFKNPASQPVPWDQLNRSAIQPKTLSPNLKSLALAVPDVAAVARGGIRIQIAPPETRPADDESRMNRSTYETIRNKRLYSVEGIEAAALAAKDSGARALVQFEPLSKEVKARWKHLAACDTNAQCGEKRRFHWRSVEVNGQRQVWGLVSLHIITKDLPNWFWADFGHVDCERRMGACADEDEAALTPPRDTTTRGVGGGEGPAGKDGVRRETEGSKWQFYILRGSQTDFVTPAGIDWILSNPVIESGFQPSSCITCHSYASAGLSSVVPNTGTSLPLLTGAAGVRNASSRSQDVGKPKCERFYTPKGDLTGKCPGFFEDGTPLYFQTDFLWSIPFRAFSEK